MARRRSHIAKRFQHMRGLPAGEKSLLIRVGEVLDSMINNRGPSNPSEPGRRRVDPKLPPPTQITHEPGIRSAKLTWPAVDSSILSHYKLIVTNLETGNTENFISYTNTFFFKGRIGGNYKAIVNSVGRGGTESINVATINFFVSEDVMQLEGAKNSFNAVGTTIFEDIRFEAGQSIYVWSAFTLDKLIGGAATGNTEVAVRLYISPEGSTELDDNAVLVDENTQYIATESFACLDVDALGDNIDRPTLEEPALSDSSINARGGTYETTYELMFRPIQVTALTQGKRNVFFIQVVGRETEADITGLSISLWAANDGTGDFAVSDPLTDPDPAVVIGHKNSIEIHAGYDESDSTDQYLHDNTLANGFNRFGITSRWTIAFWIKWLRLGSPVTLFHTWEDRAPDTSRLYNSVNISFERVTTGIGGFPSAIRTRVIVGDKDGNTGTWTRDDNYDGGTGQDVDVLTQDWQGVNALFQNNDEGVLNIPLLNHWWFIVFRYNENNGVRVSQAGTFRGASSDTTSGLTFDETGARNTLIGSAANNLYSSGEFIGSNTKGTQPAVCRLHAVGMWSEQIRLGSDELALYNAGNGTEFEDGDPMDWRQNKTILEIPTLTWEYKSGNQLVHYWQMGAVDTAKKWIARDTGINPLESGGNDGDRDMSDPDVAADGLTVDNVVNDYPGA